VKGLRLLAALVALSGLAAWRALAEPARPGNLRVTAPLASPPSAPPTAPILTAVAVSEQSIQWSWTAAGTAAGYRVLGPSGRSLSGDLGAGTTYWIETGLGLGASSTLRIAAFNAAGVSTSAATTRFTLAAPPSNMAVTDVSSSAVGLSWHSNGNPAAISYEVSYSSVDAFLTGSAISTAAPVIVKSLPVGDLAGGATYYFRVRAYNGDGAPSAFSDAVSVFTLPTPSSTPLAGTALSPQAIQWSWSTVGDAAGYKVLTLNGVQLSGTLPAGATFWVETGLSTGAAVSRELVAFNASGVSAPSSAGVFTLAEVPSSLSVGAVSSSTVALSWHSNSNPASIGYEVSYSSVDAFLTEAAVSTAPRVAAKSMTFGSLASGATYYFRVRAYNGDGLPTAFAATVSALTRK